MDADYLEYYKNLLILQYRAKPKALATIAAVVSVNIFYDLLQKIMNGYDISRIEDTNQKTLVSIIGIDDNTNGIQVSRICFGYNVYGQRAPVFAGYRLYGDLPNDYIFPTYGDRTRYKYDLTPGEILIALQFGVFRNSGNCTLKSIHDFMRINFPGVTVTEVGNMMLLYSVPSNQAQIFNILYAQNLLPKSTGVGIQFEYV